MSEPVWRRCCRGGCLEQLDVAAVGPDEDPPGGWVRLRTSQDTEEWVCAPHAQEAYREWMKGAGGGDMP